MVIWDDKFLFFGSLSSAKILHGLENILQVLTFVSHSFVSFISTLVCVWSTINWSLIMVNPYYFNWKKGVWLVLLCISKVCRNPKLSQNCPVKDYHNLCSLCILCILYRKYSKFYFEDYLCGQNILHFILHEKCERGTKKAIFPEIKFYRAICRRGVARRGCDNAQDWVANCGKPGPTAPHCATLRVFVPNNFKINFQHWHNKF